MNCPICDMEMKSKGFSVGKSSAMNYYYCANCNCEWHTDGKGKWWAHIPLEYLPKTVWEDLLHTNWLEGNTTGWLKKHRSGAEEKGSVRTRRVEAGAVHRGTSCRCYIKGDHDNIYERVLEPSDESPDLEFRCIEGPLTSFKSIYVWRKEMVELIEEE